MLQAQHLATCVEVLLSTSMQAFLKASSIFRQAGALRQALHAYNGMRRMGVVSTPIDTQQQDCIRTLADIGSKWMFSQ